jgi:tetratricopeptide (TPR) repeat protein
MRLRIHVQAFVLIAMVVGFVGLPGAKGAATDAVVDAKRRAASDLMKAGKTDEAISLLGEVLKADEKSYKDHLMLGRAYDKVNKPSEAVQSYRRVLELLGPGEDRAARTEVERRLKVLDAQMLKIQAAEDEFLKKLETLERDAHSANDTRAFVQVLKLKGSVWQASGRPGAGGMDVSSRKDWADSGIVVTAGKRYRIQAIGTWKPNPATECNCEGITNKPGNAYGPWGAMLMQIAGHNQPVVVRPESFFQAPATGSLVFAMNEPTAADRNDNAGSIYVLVQPE